MRLFFGLKPDSQSALDIVNRRERFLPPMLHPVPVDNLHITLSFLGQVKELQLEDNGVHGLEDAHLMPSMSYVSIGPGTGNVYMRGVSSGGESAVGSNPNVAVYMDEQPVTAVGAYMNPHIYDIQRIETLAGPQGTLFGANAQAGCVAEIQHD